MKNSKLLVGIIIVLVFVFAVVYIWFIWLPEQVRISFENRGLNIMKNLNSTETKTQVISWFERDYNFTEIYDWVHEKLEFVPLNETFEDRSTDPSNILESGKGRCQEFSILYVAACLAHGYQSRIVVAVDISDPRNLIVPHAWAEVKLDGWIHVDPSDRVWNEPYRYEAWSWGKDIGSNIRIIAFEEGRYEDVTLHYKQ